jgi:hypothetical protein
MDVGNFILDQIVMSRLFSPTCSESDEHACIVVWSSGAAGQLEAIYEKAKEW